MLTAKNSYIFLGRVVDQNGTELYNFKIKSFFIYVFVFNMVVNMKFTCVII